MTRLTKQMIIDALNAQIASVDMGSKNRRRLRDLRKILMETTGQIPSGMRSAAIEDLEGIVATPATYDSRTVRDGIKLLSVASKEMKSDMFTRTRVAIQELASSTATEIPDEIEETCEQVLEDYFGITIVSRKIDERAQPVLSTLEGDEVTDSKAFDDLLRQVRQLRSCIPPND